MAFQSLFQLSGQTARMTKITEILSGIQRGDSGASDQFLPVVYEELRKLAAAKLANEKPGQTWQPTALVHEAYLRLVGADNAQHWNSRGHFFGAAAEAMRRLLLNRARDKGRLKRGGHLTRIDFDSVQFAIDTPADSLLAVDEAIAALGEVDPDSAELVKMRFFAGLTLDESAAALGISHSTAKRRWLFARAWLYDALRQADDPESP